MKDIDRYRGCLIGGAAGDALGYAVEFLDEHEIYSYYGEKGITEYSLKDGIAEISDDTQMTLFTATGLLIGTTRGRTRGIVGTYPSYINFSYKDWYRTQTESYPLPDEYHYSWLVNLPEMFSWRAPGNTCLSAIENKDYGTIEAPINNSKGCGGVMRVAPIGLYFEGKNYSVEMIDRIGAETAAITHGHSLGYIPAAGLVHIIHLVAHNDDISMLDAVEDMKNSIAHQFAEDKHLQKFLKLIDKAIELATNEDIDDLDAIRELGEGWVAEETLAIAIYCSLKYCDDFDKAIIASVNHSGDSDSTGAVTGNIMGAYLGLKGIPQKYLDNLELRDVIMDIADDLFNDCKMTEYSSYHDEIWEQKYIYNTYRSKVKEVTAQDKPSNIIVFPDFQKLKDDVEKLKTELSMLMLERDELRFVICKNIETEYMLKIGGLEYKVYEAQCAVLRLKRKIELIQAKKNRQEKIILSKIEETLDKEFEEYQQRLNAQIEKLNEALEHSKAEYLSEEDNRELKKLYRKIVKNLHPDINMDVTSAQIKLLESAVNAYKNGDLITLRMINEMVGDSQIPETHQDAVAQLAEEKERIEGLIKAIRDDIDNIKAEYPYSMKSVLEDPEKTEQMKDELEDMLSQYKELIVQYKLKVEEMLG